MDGAIPAASQDLRAYLQTSGWTVDRSNELREIWVSQEGQRVFLPMAPGPDVGDLLNLALAEVGSAEQRPLSDIRAELTWQQYDRVLIRREAPPNGLHLTDAIDLHEALYDSVLASALAVAEARRSYSGRRPAAVDTFIDSVRMIPSVQGSFVVRALLPLAEPPEQATLEGFPEPDRRPVTRALIRSAATAVATAEAVAAGSPPSLWNTAVDAGVSANLCDALSRLPGDPDGDGGDAELAVDWTWRVPEQPAERVRVAIGLAPVLAAGADFLRDQPEEHQVVMVGLVTKLHRESATGDGEITVKGHIEGWDANARTLRFGVDATTYSTAIGAHEGGQSVRVAADVTRGQRGFVVTQFTALTVIS
jgi:hypothetical protein